MQDESKMVRNIKLAYKYVKSKEVKSSENKCLIFDWETSHTRCWGWGRGEPEVEGDKRHEVKPFGNADLSAFLDNCWSKVVYM